MWRTVGTANPNDKNNRSRQEHNYEPFAQASRLRLNESQLSGEKSPQFMTEYFAKRRSPEGIQRVLSQKSLQVRQCTSPPASLRDVPAYKSPPKAEQNEVGVSAQHSLNELALLGLGNSIDGQVGNKKQFEKYESLRGEVRAVRDEQVKLKKTIKNEMNKFTQEIIELQNQVIAKISNIQAERQKAKEKTINPELVTRIRQEGARFNERMREIDSRKAQILAKYDAKINNG